MTSQVFVTRSNTLRLLVVGPGRVWIDRAEPVAIVSSELHSETCESVTHTGLLDVTHVLSVSGPTN